MKKYYDGDVTCDITEIHEDGTIYLAECSVNGELVDGYTYGEKQPICTKVSDVATSTDASILYEAGDKYTCKVDPNKEAYTFFILNTVANDATSINLISESNIDSTGTPIKTNDAPKSFVAWQTSGKNVDGPVAAMNFLQQATSSWTNLTEMTVAGWDDDNGSTYPFETPYTVKARLPYRSELNAAGCKGYKSESCPLWLVNYLIDECQPY